MAPLDVGYAFAEFADTGGFTRSIGAQGAGPGEFAYVANLYAGSGDSILAYDPGNGRIQVYTPDLVLFRTFQLLQTPNDLVPLRNGGYVVSDRAPYDRLLRLLDAAGQTVAARGPLVDPRPTHNTGGMELAVAPGGHIFGILHSQYTIFEFDESAMRVRSLVRSTKWFPERRSLLHPNRRSAVIKDMAVDSSGLLWVLISLPKPIPVRELAQQGGTRLTPTQILKEQTPVLEVIEPAVAPRLLAHAEFPETYLKSFVDGSAVVSQSVDNEGVSLFTVWRFHLNVSAARAP